MDRRIAILGDIHANLTALRTVLADCEAQGVTDYICTGDIVGYNPWPHECLELVRELKYNGAPCPVVMGNHDFYVSHKDGIDLDDFNPNAKIVIEWTRKQMSMDEIYYLKSIPFTVVKEGMTIVHSTLDKPEKFGYVFEVGDVIPHFSLQKTPVCFNGHTHFPGILERQLGGIYEISSKFLLEERDGIFDLLIGRKYLVNVGSVGQPRDGDPRASYVIYEPKLRRVKFRRLEYDIAEVQARIREVGLPEHLAERLATGN